MDVPLSGADAVASAPNSADAVASAPNGADAVASAPSPNSVLQRVYDGIRHGIITGTIAQGTRLNENRFAESFEVSRVPIREAIRRLEHDGFVIAEPRRSAVVSTWTADRVIDLFDARLALEVEAARYAARRVREGASTAGLARRLAATEQSIASGDHLEIAKASTQFHIEVVELTQNRLLRSLMRTISHEMIWLFYLTSQRDARKACDEHHDMLDAIASGKEELARTVTYTHIERGREPSLANFDRGGPGPA
ncbi:GntR family transcriptional regulator [Nonomuraea sp. CA-143628]|uniref:GntR family transcriptional regulator n=1 Tax=Nonomuraea sp. CA-143628 TaxID=3239997 RepID=UPI003D8E2386